MIQYTCFLKLRFLMHFLFFTLTSICGSCIVQKYIQNHNQKTELTLDAPFLMASTWSEGNACRKKQKHLLLQSVFPHFISGTFTSFLRKSLFPFCPYLPSREHLISEYENCKYSPISERTTAKTSFSSMYTPHRINLSI